METKQVSLPPGGMLRSTNDLPTDLSHSSSGRKVTGILSPLWGTPELLVNLSFGDKTLSNVSAILDSGAYRCMVSPQMAQQLNLTQAEGHAQYQNPVLGTVQTPLYSIGFSFAGLDQVFIYQCQIMPQMYEWGLLLGTEFLRQCTLHYYGKERYFELIV
ncbi:pepsin/retropepsin-like aspartic protease family protein [Spirosoma validum]|uniref:Retroviral-like aspartic protease family protein n=1 Tax=Spirosoma validum TaxID=2771355 RepID=A0A927AZ97_9BACT|nr:retroviral-like aspartic protease family protein [Spirosoma validum]MBD2752616.1 retroviral-like aspartic protease family protein [Spirosoma validum]